MLLSKFEKIKYSKKTISKISNVFCKGLSKVLNISLDLE